MKDHVDVVIVTARGQEYKLRTVAYQRVCEWQATKVVVCLTDLGQIIIPFSSIDTMEVTAA